MSDSVQHAAAWRVPVAELVWFEDSGACIVYSDRSGRTHRLDPASGLVFSAARERAMSAPELGWRLAARWGVAAAEIEMDALLTTIRELEEAGLLVRAEA